MLWCSAACMNSSGLGMENLKLWNVELSKMISSRDPLVQSLVSTTVLMHEELYLQVIITFTHFYFILCPKRHSFACSSLYKMSIFPSQFPFYSNDLPLSLSLSFPLPLSLSPFSLFMYLCVSTEKLSEDTWMLQGPRWSQITDGWYCQKWWKRGMEQRFAETDGWSK